MFRLCSLSRIDSLYRKQLNGYTESNLSVTPTAIDRLHRKHATEERSIAAQRQAKIFGRHAVAAAPLSFETSSFFSEDLCQALHGASHKSIGLLHSLARLIDKTNLDGIPPRMQVRRLRAGEHGRALFLRGCAVLC